MREGPLGDLARRSPSCRRATRDRGGYTGRSSATISACSRETSLPISTRSLDERRPIENGRFVDDDEYGDPAGRSPRGVVLPWIGDFRRLRGQWRLIALASTIRCRRGEACTDIVHEGPHQEDSTAARAIAYSRARAGPAGRPDRSPTPSSRTRTTDAGLTVVIARPRTRYCTRLRLIAAFPCFIALTDGFADGDAEAVNRVVVEPCHVGELLADLVDQLQHLERRSKSRE